jgi:uncharacterized protein (TIGR03437 family)
MKYWLPLLCCSVGLSVCQATTDPRLEFSRILPVLLDSNTVSGAINAIRVDAAGNTYLTGYTQNSQFPVTAGVVQPAFGGGTCTDPTTNPLLPSFTHPCSDAFVAKLDPLGNIVFATFLGGVGADQGTSIALDSVGNVYIIGTTGAPSLSVANNFPTTANSPFGSAAGGSVFIAKFNPSGTALLYSFLIPGLDGPGGLATDAQGNVYFAGGTSDFAGGPMFPMTSGALAQKGTIAVGKLNPSGSQLLYASHFGGSGGGAGLTDTADDIAVDSAGNAYITGFTASPDFPVTPGVVQPVIKTHFGTAFVAKLNRDGSALVYATYLGGSAIDSGKNIRIDSQGDAFVLGNTQSLDFPVTAGELPVTTFNATTGGFLTKVSPDGSRLLYSTYVAGLLGFTGDTDPLRDGVGFDVDAAGNAFLTGGASTGLPVTSTALQTCPGGGFQDAFVAQVSMDGKLAALTYLGGSLQEYGSTIAAIPDGTVVVGGFTNSQNFPGTSTSTAGQYFVARLRIADASLPVIPCLTGSLENAASNIQGPVAPGELVTFRGFAFGPERGAGTELDAAGLVAKDLAGVQVFFDDIPAPVLYAQAQQINAQAPFEISGKTTTMVHVVYQGASSATVPIAVSPAEPDFFRTDYGSTQGYILNQDGTPNSPSNPAKAGEIVAAFGTGGGIYDPTLATGEIVPIGPFFYLTQKVVVKIDDGLEADVVYAGAAPTRISGVFQINFRIPDGVVAAFARHTLDVTIGPGSTNPLQTVTISIQ